MVEPPTHPPAVPFPTRVPVFSPKQTTARAGLLLCATGKCSRTQRNSSTRNALRCRRSLLTRGQPRTLVALSAGGALLLLALEAALPPPEGLPFLHPTLNALYSCANLTAAYGIGVYWQWREGEAGRGGGERGSPREAETKKRR